MPTPVFPTTLPLVSKFTITPNDGVLTDEDDGVKNFRLRTLDRGAKGSAEWTFIQSDLSVFNTFRRDDLLNGHRQFCIQLPSAAGISCHIVRMLNAQIKPIGYGAYTVTCELEIRSRAFDICECPVTGGGGGGGEPPVIAWAAPVNSIAGTFAHSNSGTVGAFNFLPPFIYEPFYAGVVGYTEGEVVWSASWTPVASDPAPTLSYPSPGIVQVDYSFLGGGFNHYNQGLLVLTATLDGVPTAAGEGIQIATNPLFGVSYTTMAWGPEP